MPWVDPSTHTNGYLVDADDWNELVNNFKYQMEVGYTAFTSNVSVTATSEGTANTIVSAGAITFEAVPHLIEVYVPRFGSGAAAMRVSLFDGSTSQGLLASFDASLITTPFRATHRLVPSAGSHTYSVRAWNSSAATGTASAGSGGTGTNFLPGYIRIVRVPI